MSSTLLRIQDLNVHYAVRRKGGLRPRMMHVLHDISFNVAAGETLGVVGESGCGKSTLGKSLLRLIPVTSGTVCLDGTNLLSLPPRQLRRSRKRIQAIFQDPIASLDPRMTVGNIIGEPLLNFFPELNRLQRRRQVIDMMEKVGLLPNQINRYAHEFSGGQAQRIGIARALISGPDLIVCDEPTSALDVSIKAQIVNLLEDLQQTTNVALLFITHDLSVVRHISHRVLVLYMGRIMELAPREALYSKPLHPYTRTLIGAVPVPDPRKAKGISKEKTSADKVSPNFASNGCIFRARCRHAVERCRQETPELRRLGRSLVACHRAEQISDTGR